MSLRAKEISQESGINKTSTFRFIETLVHLGYLNKNPKTKLLTLGPKAIYLGLNLVRSFKPHTIIKQFIDEAHNIYNISIDSALWDGDKIFLLYERQVKDTLVFINPKVITELQYFALGKAVLSHLPEDEMLKIIDRLSFIKRTKNSISTKQDLIADLEKTKKRGYSLNNEEYIPGLISIGAPLFSAENNQVIGAISCGFSTIQHSIKTIEKEYADIIVKTAKDISKISP